MDSNEIKINVEKALEEIRPYLLTDGGDVSLVSIKEDIVEIKFTRFKDNPAKRLLRITGMNNLDE